MTVFGYFLSSEELAPGALVQVARTAEAVGFERAWISDHYHPWNDEQGESGFVWSMIGAIAAGTNLTVTTAVTCPTVRLHPAIVAQAAATCSQLLEGRFALGVGSGEFLNEHVVGQPWPPAERRQEMLAEAVELIRRLLTGDWVTHYGRHYTVEDARLYSKPAGPIPVYVSGFGAKSIELAARIGDGFITTSPSAEDLQLYRRHAGKGPSQAGVKVCWAPREQDAVKTAHRLWANSGVPGEASQELRMPRHFEQVSKLVTEDMTASAVACGPDPQRHLESIRKYVDAGFDEVYVAQMGPDQDGFLRFWEKELAPRLT